MELSVNSRSDAVVLLHGIARTSACMNQIERALQNQGFATLNIDYPARKKDIESLVEEIRPRIVRLAERTSEQVHFVGHSMGCLITRAYIARYRPERLGRVVMLGPPNQGSEVADLLRGNPLYKRIFGPAGDQLTTRRVQELNRQIGPVDYPLGIIAGTRSLDPISARLVLPRPNDGKVSVARTKIDGMASHLVLPVTHTLTMKNPVVIRETIRFLRHGEFSPQSE
jgi:pimeloyl-ACP methyl ester carboxylesterase